MHWRRKWHPTLVFFGESQGQRSLVGCRRWGAQSRTWLKGLSSSSSSQCLGLSAFTSGAQVWSLVRERKILQSARCSWSKRKRKKMRQIIWALLSVSEECRVPWKQTSKKLTCQGLEGFSVEGTDELDLKTDGCTQRRGCSENLEPDHSALTTRQRPRAEGTAGWRHWSRPVCPARGVGCSLCVWTHSCAHRWQAAPAGEHLSF